MGSPRVRFFACAFTLGCAPLVAGENEGEGGASHGSGGAGTSSTGTLASVAVCAGDRELSIAIDGIGQDAFEGRTVWLSAVEPDPDAPDGADPIVAFVRDVVVDGGFDLQCASGLGETYAYPSWAVVVDVDGDGTCSDGDVGHSMQLYGWESDQVLSFEGAALLSYTNGSPWVIAEDVWQPVAGATSWGRPFCDYYAGR